MLYTVAVTVSRVWQILIVACFFLVNAAGLLKAATAVEAPLPGILLMSSYGMMSVFSVTSESNWEIVADGIGSDGVRHRVALTHYFPMRQGFINEFTYNLWRFGGQAYYDALATRLLERERAGGSAFASLELVQETWPRSAQGYQAERKPPKLTQQVLARAIAPAVQ